LRVVVHIFEPPTFAVYITVKTLLKKPPSFYKGKVQRWPVMYPSSILYVWQVFKYTAAEPINFYDFLQLFAIVSSFYELYAAI
jgi:hypothetical protein